MRISFIVLLALLMSCKSEPSNSNTSENSEEEKTQITNQVAQAYGIENWDNVEEVNFSFVVNPGENESVRKWSWKPKSNTVTLYQNGDEITYDKNNLDDGYVQTDKAFVNDSFWLLFPFHLVWDNIDFTFEENAISPINKVKCSKIIVRYPQEGGYTPGDRYDVYIDKDHNILEWSYYPSGQREPVLMNTFEDLSGFNGIKVNLTHRNPDTGFQLVFRDVSIK